MISSMRSTNRDTTMTGMAIDRVVVRLNAPTECMFGVLMEMTEERERDLVS